MIDRADLPGRQDRGQMSRTAYYGPSNGRVAPPRSRLP